MKPKPNHLRVLNAWPLLAIVTNELGNRSGMNYDDHFAATLLFISSGIWGFPIILADWLLGLLGIAASDWAIYLASIALFIVLIEGVIRISNKSRITPNTSA